MEILYKHSELYYCVLITEEEKTLLTLITPDE